MIFSSATFLAFFVAVLMLYLVTRSIQQRATLLLVASIIFYASWKPSYLLLLGASLAINYLIFRALLARRSRLLLMSGIVVNLLTLGACKYLRFAVESTLSISRYLGMATETHAPTWMNWALPLGISFYTFHMLSALIDVYRGVWAKPVTFARWCLYVTFFPHLIAGPILRPGQLIDQLGDLKPVEATGFRLGVAIFIAGLIKKVLFADNLAPIVDKLYAFPGTLDFTTAWLATLAFAFQIYFDFSGYSEMAIGLARIFGVTLPRNFIYPYISRSPREFWRRWHITLSLWLRDYLYIPLGGSKGSTARTYSNLITTMLLGGLWHGANWTFVVWGGLHGLYLLGARLFDQAWALMRISDRSPVRRSASILGAPLTFILVCFAWVFFRAADFGQAWSICGSMVGLGHPQTNGPPVRTYEIAVITVSALLVVVEPMLVKMVAVRGIGQWWRVPFPVRGIAYAALVLILVVLGGQTMKFIYFDF
jgi:alginate O-acetyltransferase complex protein AlgI